MTDSNDKVKEIERELELYNVRIRGILTEVNNDQKEMQNKILIIDNEVQNFRKDLIGVQQLKMFKDPSSKNVSVFTGMQNLNNIN